MTRPHHCRAALPLPNLRLRNRLSQRRPPTTPARPVRALAAPRERPPGTIRLDDRAGQALWEAYVHVKTQDPFLSYRQFSSQIILDGLTAHRRRQQRTL